MEWIFSQGVRRLFDALSLFCFVPPYAGNECLTPYLSVVAVSASRDDINCCMLKTWWRLS